MPPFGSFLVQFWYSSGTARMLLSPECFSAAITSPLLGRAERRADQGGWTGLTISAGDWFVTLLRMLQAVGYGYQWRMG